MPTGQNKRGIRYRSHQVPKLLGMRGKEFRRRRELGIGPVPDGVMGFTREDFWYEDTLWTWYRKTGAEWRAN